MSDHDNVAMTYNDDITARIYKEWIPNTLCVSLIRHVNLEYFGHLKGKSIVEFGCGTGSFLRTCMEKGAKTCLGFDINETMIKAGGNSVRNGTEKLNGGLHFRIQDCFKPLLEIPGQFDFAVCQFVLHDCKDETALQTFLKNVSNLLKPGGRIFIGMCPYVANTLNDQEIIADLCGYQQPMRDQSEGKDPYFADVPSFVPCQPSETKNEAIFGRNEMFAFRDYFWSKEKLMENVEKAGFRKVEFLKAAFPAGVSADHSKKIKELEEPFICIGARKGE